MATLTELIADVRAATDTETDLHLTDAVATSWLNQEYFAVRRILGDVVPTLYSAVSTPTISTGNTISFPSDFAKVRRLERDYGSGNYRPLDVGSATDPDGVGRYAENYSYLERLNTIEVYPSTNATGSYRLTYITKPTKLTNGTDVCDVPEGVERVLVERVAARVRMRRQETQEAQLHTANAAAALAEAKSYLQKRYPQPKGLL